MPENALPIEVRDATGKGVARKLRAAGRIPGVCYGKGKASVPLSLDPHVLRKLLDASDAGMNTIISLSGGDALDGTIVLLRELQRDPVRGAYLHADFFAIDVQARIEVSVPVHLVGHAAGVEAGGVLDQAMREVEVECMPLAIPKEISADVSALDIGESLHVRDLILPEGVELISDPELSVVSVVAPMKEEAAAAEEGVEAAEGAEAPAAAGREEGAAGEEGAGGD